MLVFEQNKIENSVRIFQTNYKTKVRIASRHNETGKISLASVYRKQIERDRTVTLKDACIMLEDMYQKHLRDTSPLRNLTDEQMIKIISDMKAINTLAICFQDKIDSLRILDNLDSFGEVTSDLSGLKDVILKFTSKLAKVIGADQTIGLGDVADDVSKLLEQRL